MTHHEIRKKFIDFFEKRGHKVVPSSSLLPDDPSVLFTTAGMQQFKPYYTNPEAAKGKFNSVNTVSIQKCLRTSDIDKVGDESHLTFFEMLGNFSFGGYWKKEAIKLAHEFIIKELGLEIDYVTVFEGKGDIPADEESESVWKSLNPNLKIIRRSDDNIWGPTGDEGPFGPTTEIYANGLEVWNIVFNQYYRHKKLESKPGERVLSPGFSDLVTKGIDTGMGLERLAMVVQEKKNIFETDLFSFIINSLENTPERSKRIIADHVRAAVFMIADGVIPSNKDQGSILRTLIKRVIAHLGDIDAGGQFLVKREESSNYSRIKNITDIAEEIINEYSKIKDYSYLNEKKTEILNTFLAEKDRFLEIYPAGKKKLFEFIKEDKGLGLPMMSGIHSSMIVTTYGIPLELVRDIVKKQGMEINEEELKKEEEKHQEISRAGAEKKFK